MSDLTNKVAVTKDKMLGEVKETVGKTFGNESLELKGKIQSIKADFEKKTEVSSKADKIKEEIFKKANDIIDKTKD